MNVNVRLYVFLLFFYLYFFNICFVSAELIPLPKKIISKNFTIEITDWKIVTDTENERYNFSAWWLNNKSGLNLEVITFSEAPEIKRIVLGNPKEHYFVKEILEKNGLKLPSIIGKEGYLLDINENEIIISANTQNGVFYGVQTLLQLLTNASLKGVLIIDWPDYSIRAVHVSRKDSPLYFEKNGNKPLKFTDKQKEYIDKLAGWKINTIIYSDTRGDFFKGKEYIEPYKQLKKYCEQRFIKFIPSIASLRNIFGFSFDVLEGWWIRDEKFRFDNNNFAVPEKPFKNLLENGGFEKDEDKNGLPDGWGISGTAVIDSKEKYEGKYSLKIIPGGSCYLEFPVEENKHYLLTAQVKGDRPVIVLQARDENDKILYSRYDRVKTSINYWKKLGVVLRIYKDVKKIRISLYGKGTVWMDDVRFYRVDGGLKNVIRTNTTDIMITNLNKSVTYKKDIDYKIIDGETNILFDEKLKPFKIKRIPSGKILPNQEVLVSYDSRLYYARSSNYNQPPCVSEKKLYTEFYYPAIDKVVTHLQPEIIFFASDEIRGFNRDSRNRKREKTNAELLAEWINKINSYLKSKDPSCRMALWDDMLSPYHNGGIYNYQIQYGGSYGRTAEVIEKNMINNDTILFVWWYNDIYLPQMNASIEFFTAKKFNILGSPWYDIQNIQSWSELLLGNSYVLGGIDTDWGIGDINIHYPVFADHFWNTRYKVIYFNSFERDSNGDGLPDGWHYMGKTPSLKNLLLNPSFENDFEGWEITHTSFDTPSINLSTSRDGNKSVYFKSDGINQSRIRSGYIPVEPNENYIISCWAKGKEIEEGEKGWHKLYLIGRFYDENKKIIHQNYLDLSISTGSFDWKYFKNSRVSPANATYYRITGLGLIGTGRGEGWIDELKFYKEIPQLYSCDGKHMYGRRIANFSKCAISVSGDNTWYSDPIKISPHSSYILSFYVKREKSGKEKPEIKIEWLDENLNKISEEIKVLNDINLTYNLYEISLISPLNASYLKIYLKGQKNGKEYFWYDTLTLKIKNTPPDQPPYFLPFLSEKEIEKNTPFNLTLYAYDIDSDTVDIRVQYKPKWLEVSENIKGNPGKINFFGTPTQTGTFFLNLTASDGNKETNISIKITAKEYQSKTYYVDCENGNDSNDGLTPFKPWKTISKVNNHSFYPGDRILFKRGCIWRETLIPPSSGEKGKLIVFGAYGEGEKPRITGGDVADEWKDEDNDGVWEHEEDNEVYVLMDNGEKLSRSCEWGKNWLKRIDPGEWTYKNGKIYYKPKENISGHLIEKSIRNHPVYIHEKSYLRIENIRVDCGNKNRTVEHKENALIYIQNSSHIEIVNCDIFFGSIFGISLNGCEDVNISYNEIKDIDSRGINIGGGCSNILISRNNIHHQGEHGRYDTNDYIQQDMEGIAISACGSSGRNPHDVVIEYNEIHHNGNHRAKNANKGKGITLCGGCDEGKLENITIRYNKIYENYACGITLEGLNGMNYKIYHNLIYNNGIGKMYDNGRGAWGGIRLHAHQGSNVKVDLEIYNNLIWNNTGGPGTQRRANLLVFVHSGKTINLTLKNNIIGMFQDDSGYDIQYVLWGGKLVLSSDYNCFYEDKGDKNVIRYGDRIYTFSNLICNKPGCYSYEKNQDHNSLAVNPEFIDEENKDFHLSSQSPCINNGTDVGIKYDIEGRPIPYGYYPDIGPYETYFTKLLAKFLIHKLPLPIGSQSKKIKIIIKNFQTRKDVINLSLSGYNHAYFLDNSRQTSIELEPMEERTVYIKVYSTVPEKFNKHTLTLYAISKTNKKIRDKDTLVIILFYPQTFYGLEDLWIIILVLLSVMIFYYKKF